MKKCGIVISNDNKCSSYETIDAIKSAGFQNVFLQWYDKDYKKFDVPQEEQLLYAKQNNLNILFNHLGYKNMNEIWGINGDFLLKKYLNNLDECYQNGVDMVVMHTCGNPPIEFTKMGLERFKKICLRAQELGIKVAFENTKVKGFLEYLISNIDLDNVGICFDCGHNFCHFRNDFNFELFKDKIFAVHIHDNHGDKDEHLLPGDGLIDYDYVIDGLIKANYEGPIILEAVYSDYYSFISVQEFMKRAFEICNTLENKREEAKLSLKK